MNLVFFDYFFTFGGAQRSTSTLLNWLSGQPGVKCIFVSPAPPNKKFLEATRVEKINLFSAETRAIQRSKEHPLSFGAMLILLAWRLSKLIKARGLQDSILITSSRKGMLTLATLKILLRPHAKLVFYARGEAARGQFTGLDKLLLRYLANKVLCVSNTTRRNLLESGVPERKIHVVYTSVDVGGLLEQRLNPPRLDKDVVTILFVGSLIPTKGLHHLIGALGHVQNADRFRIEVAGGAPNPQHVEYAESLRAQAAALQPAVDVRWHGWVDDVWPMIADAEIVCLPSYSEGFPRIVVEGMAAGRVVLASAVGGVPEMITHAKTGYIIPLEDAGIAVILDMLMAQPHAAGVGAAARSFIRERYALDRQGKLVLDALA